MPKYDAAPELVQQIVENNKKLDALFKDLLVAEDTKNNLQEIKDFYLTAFNKTTNQGSGTSIVEEYKQLFNMFYNVKSGDLNADDASKYLKITTEGRQAGIVIHNILKVCELIFWIGVAVCSYIGCVTIGLPLFALQPFVSVAVMVGTGTLFFSSAEHIGNCFTEFESFDSVNKEEARENHMISFFRPVQYEEPIFEGNLNNGNYLYPNA